MFPDPNLATANQVLAELVQRNFFQMSIVDGEAAYQIGADGEGYITFLCNLFWPFLESYMVACLTLLSIRPKVSHCCFLIHISTQ